MTLKVDKEINLRGKMCPLPIILTKKELEHIESGQTIKVVATDCAAISDFQTWAQQSPEIFELLKQETMKENGEDLYVFYIRKK